MKFGRTCVALALATACLNGFAQVAAQENKSQPLVTQGIGASNCAKLVADLKPAEGLNNPVNLMLYSWAQGYVSAANVSLLEAAGKHVDINTLDEAKVLNGVLEYCRANPTGRPVSALDELIRKATNSRRSGTPAPSAGTTDLARRNARRATPRARRKAPGVSRAPARLTCCART